MVQKYYYNKYYSIGWENIEKHFFIEPFFRTQLLL